jgi:uncharacterized membrane protein
VIRKNPAPKNSMPETLVDLARLNALNDGTFAIVLTILVFNIRIPESIDASQLPAGLLEMAPQLLVYLISFVVVGGAWGSHQRMLSQIRRGDGLLVWLNLLSLLFVTLVPASAALLGRFPGEFIAIICFAADVILIQLTALWLWGHADKYDLLNPSLLPFVVRSIGRRLILSVVAFGLSVVLYVFGTIFVYVGWIGLFGLVFATDWLSWQQVTRVTAVAIPLDSARSAHLRIGNGSGRLHMQANAGEGVLVQGTCGGDVVSKVAREGDVLKATLGPHAGWGLTSWRYPWSWWEMPGLDWDLNLNPDIPLVLHLETAAGEVDLDFTRTHLSDLKIEIGEGSINLQLPARAGKTSVQIRAGVNSIAIHVPKGVAARIHSPAVLPGLEVDVSRFPLVSGGKYEDMSEYRSANYETAANHVEIDLQMGMGTATIS